MKYISGCLLPVLIGFAVCKFFVTSVCVCEMYDTKTEREMSEAGRKSLFICPGFTKYIRFRTEFICFLLQGIFVFQLVVGIGDLDSYVARYRELFYNSIGVLVFILFLFCMIPSVIDMLLEKYIRYKNGKDIQWDEAEDIVEHELMFPRNKIIEKVKLTYRINNERPNMAMLILPSNHKLNYRGFLKSTQKHFDELVKSAPHMRTEELILGTRKIYRESVSNLEYFVEDTGSALYVYNYGNYETLSREMNRLGMAVIRLSFYDRADESDFLDMERELQEVISELENFIGGFGIILCGHGEYGVIESLLLGEKIENEGLCILGVLGEGIEDMEQNYIKRMAAERWISPREKRTMQQILMRAKENSKNCCRCNGRFERMCNGYCAGSCTNYFASLCNYNGDDLKKIIKNYKKPLLHIQPSKDVYAIATDIDPVISDKENIEHYVLENVYQTLRKKNGKTYVLKDLMYAHELVQNVKVRPGTLTLKNDVEIDKELIDIIEKWINCKMFLKN